MQLRTFLRLTNGTWENQMMSKDIKTYEELNKIILDAIRKSLPKIGKEIGSVLRFYVQQNWYNSVTPEFYERTMDVLNSITVGDLKETSDGFSIEIYFDNDKIRQSSSSFEIPSYLPRFHHHMSVNGDMKFNGISIAEWVVWWMNYGQDSPLHSYEGVHFWEDTLKMLNGEQEKYHVERLCDLLEQIGFEIEL